MALTLKALRINAGLDQKEAAAMLEVSPETLSKWEREITFPTVKQISKIEELYGVTYADINFLPSEVGKTDNNSEVK